MSRNLRVSIPLIDTILFHMHPPRLNLFSYIHCYYRYLRTWHIIRSNLAKGWRGRLRDFSADTYIKTPSQDGFNDTAVADLELTVDAPPWEKLQRKPFISAPERGARVFPGKETKSLLIGFSTCTL